MDNLTDSSSINSVPGKAWIKGGKVFVEDPVGEGEPAIIIPHELTKVTVNGDRLSGSKPVKKQDEIVVEMINSETPGKVTVKTTPDGLSASIDVSLTIITNSNLIDQEPRNNLALAATTETEERFPMDQPLFMQELKSKNVIHGLDFATLRDILANPKNGSFTIAKGEAPGKAVNDRIELIFQESHGIETSAQKINLLEINQIVSVKKGDILAIRHPGKEGSPGKKVSGELIIPLQPLILTLVAGDGTELSDDSNRLFALRDGSPIVKQSGQNYHVAVEHVLKISEDVGVSTGNIRFSGDVVISENVREGMTVQASGSITVSKMVFTARIGAQENITIAQNAVGSNIVAGVDSDFYKRISRMLEDLYSGLSEMAKAIPSIMNHPKFTGGGAGQIIQLLIEKKYTGFPGLIIDLKKNLKQNEFVMNKEIFKLIDGVCDNLTGINILKVKEVSDLNRLAETIWEVKDNLNTLSQSTADISIGHATGCEVEASGNVSIIGTGCINTTIRAGKSVNVKGVFRGGKITAKRDVILGEAGSGTGTRTVIQTSEKGKITIKKAHEGVEIWVGSHRTNITSEQAHIKARLDSNGNLAFD